MAVGFRGVTIKKSSLSNFNERLWRDKPGDWFSILAALVTGLSFLSAGSSVAGQAKAGWDVEWEKTVAAARQEGQVTIYGTTPIHAIAETGVFQKVYPGIKVVTVAPAPGEAFQRLMAERRAGRYLADLYVAGATSPLWLLQAQALDPIKPLLIFPEVVDESKWWGGRHHYNDHEQRYIFVYTGNPVGTISFNSNLVNQKEISSFWDLLHPKWKGKIEIRDMRRTPGAGSINVLFFYHNLQMGPKYIKRLFGEMDITFFREIRQGINWLATGKFLICFFCGDVDIGKAKCQGLPVARLDFMLKEGSAITSHAGALGFVNRAPHPSAAKVFINWLLSREGQLTSQNGASNPNSRRIDISKEMIPPHGRLIEGVNYLDVETPERNDIGPVIKIIEEALAETEKRKKG
jgi:iron(III) transport system substrate-binding protein